MAATASQLLLAAALLCAGAPSLTNAFVQFRSPLFTSSVASPRVCRFVTLRSTLAWAVRSAASCVRP